MNCLLKKTLGQKCLRCGHELPIVRFSRRVMSSATEQIPDTNEEILDVEKYREDNGIKVFGRSVPDPISSFGVYQWPGTLSDRIIQLGFSSPTPVQSQTLPAIMANRDVVSIASSGSGKTLCFVLPALMRILRAKLDEWPKCLILTPTRELTHQIDKVVKTFRFARSVCLYGGVSHEIQEMLLKRANPHIVIATPSRLQSVLERGKTTLSNVDYIVVDEADRMLSTGNDISQVMRLLPKKQTVMFSATWPPSVRTIADQFLKDYIRISISQNESMESLTVNKNIEQTVKVCKESDKLDQFLQCIDQLVPTISGYLKTIIFVRKKSTADRLVKVLKRQSYPARALHSSKDQRERDFVIREFRKGTIPILIATDVAARGLGKALFLSICSLTPVAYCLDFKNVHLIINYDFPSSIEDYIHRIGRTGRYKNKGKAVTFFTPINVMHKSNLISVLNESKQIVDQKLIDLTEESDLESSDRSDKSEDSGYDSSQECQSGDDLDSHESESEFSDNSHENFHKKDEKIIK